MKLPGALPYRSATPLLKSKEPRLRDWNECYDRTVPTSEIAWNQKNLDYEIETNGSPQCPSHQGFPWNQKNLDYEIETTMLSNVAKYGFALEIKRTSITRLKQVYVAVRNRGAGLKSKEPRLRDWNCLGSSGAPNACLLKSKEPRLRDWNITKTIIGCTRIISWNQKNLDYEIETLRF